MGTPTADTPCTAPITAACWCEAVGVSRCHNRGSPGKQALLVTTAVAVPAATAALKLLVPPCCHLPLIQVLLLPLSHHSCPTCYSCCLCADASPTCSIASHTVGRLLRLL